MGDPNAADKLFSKLPEHEVAEDNDDKVSKPNVGRVSLMTEK